MNGKSIVEDLIKKKIQINTNKHEDELKKIGSNNE